jgi:hypothetical protein
MSNALLEALRLHVKSNAAAPVANRQTMERSPHAKFPHVKSYNPMKAPEISISIPTLPPEEMGLVSDSTPEPPQDAMLTSVCMTNHHKSTFAPPLDDEPHGDVRLPSDFDLDDASVGCPSDNESTGPANGKVGDAPQTLKPMEMPRVSATTNADEDRRLITVTDPADEADEESATDTDHEEAEPRKKGTKKASQRFGEAAAAKFSIEAITDHRNHKGGWQIKVHWSDTLLPQGKTLKDMNWYGVVKKKQATADGSVITWAETWEPLSSIREQVPDLISKYLKDTNFDAAAGFPKRAKGTKSKKPKHQKSKPQECGAEEAQESPPNDVEILTTASPSEHSKKRCPPCRKCGQRRKALKGAIADIEERLTELKRSLELLKQGELSESESE